VYEQRAEILIVGGGVGGIAAALAAADAGHRVVLTEPTDWIGGQLTAQAVPPDEHQWIEEFGCTASYRRLRTSVRDYYRRNYPLLREARHDPQLNPGLGAVSRLCAEPTAWLAVLLERLAPHRAAGRIRLLLQHVPQAVHCADDRIEAVTLLDGRTGDQLTVAADYVLDATELGDVLDLAGAEHVMGSESQAQTGEPHALPGDPEPLDQQAITWCFAVDHLPGEDHTIDRPSEYQYWRRHQEDWYPGPQLSWTHPLPRSMENVNQALFAFDGDAFDQWHFRRLLYRGHYPAGVFDSDITLVNWPHNDYWLGPLVGVGQAAREKHLAGARQLSLSLLYWMQTEAPRPDGGFGYPGLRLRPDVMGTPDGLAKDVYVRESRRIRAEFTVLEQHVGVDARADLACAATFSDSVGIGSYRIDLHPSTGGRTFVDIASWPFQIPLGALIPVRLANMLPAAKNIGTTHITNGCYRLHPVEWNIGEVAGALAAYCLDRKLTPHQVRNTAVHLTDFQRLLRHKGVELAWPSQVAAKHI